jgi:hypothetical protein
MMKTHQLLLTPVDTLDTTLCTASCSAALAIAPITRCWMAAVVSFAVVITPVR